MITNFKIFENNNDKKIFYHIIKKDDFEKFYKKVKKSSILAAFYDIPDSDELAVICSMSYDEKKKYFKKGYWGEDLKSSAYMMSNFSLIDKDNFSEEWKIIKQAKKYNL